MTDEVANPAPRVAGRRLYYLRVKRGWDRRTLALLAEVAEVLLRELEQGRIRVSDGDALRRCARALGFDAELLFADQLEFAGAARNLRPVTPGSFDLPTQYVAELSAHGAAPFREKGASGAPRAKRRRAIARRAVPVAPPKRVYSPPRESVRSAKATTVDRRCGKCDRPLLDPCAACWRELMLRSR